MNEGTEELGQEYVILCFSLDNILGKGNVVDSYVGDFNVSNVELIKDKDLLVERIRLLGQKISSLNKREKSKSFLDLRSSVSSFESLAKSLLHPTNENYARQIGNIYQTALKIPTDLEIEKLKSEIVTNLRVLGYNDNWPTCYEQWNNENTVTGEEYFNSLIEYSSKLEKQTFQNIIIPIIGKNQADKLYEESSVKYELIETKELWNAYHYYYKGYESVVKINKNNSFNKQEAFFLAAHEIFPGHHTEAIVKEYYYRKGELGLSATINVLSSPFSLISEGIADYGYYFFGKEYTVNQKITHGFRRLIKTVRHKLAIQIIIGEITTEEGINLLSEITGVSEKGAEKSIRFATEKWRLYFPCYYMGYQTVSEIFDKEGFDCIKELYKYSALNLLKPYKVE